jgi:hypothetical protein
VSSLRPIDISVVREFGILALYLRYKGSLLMLTRAQGAVTKTVRLFNKNLTLRKAVTPGM